MTNNTTAHQDALRLVHEEAGRTLSKSDFDLCMRIAKRALLTSPRAAAALRRTIEEVRADEREHETFRSWQKAFHEEEGRPMEPVDAWQIRAMLDAAPAAPVAESEPIPMLLFCPRCGTQHIDAPEVVSDARPVLYADAWTNPPHRSHLCRGCGMIWRPADVPTVGVAKIETRGKADNWDESAYSTPMRIAQAPAAPVAELVMQPLTDAALREALDEFELVCENNDVRRLTDDEKYAAQEFALSLIHGDPFAAQAVAADGAATDELLQLDVLLANFHAAVWHAGAGDDGPIAFDMAGKDEAKAIQRHVRSMLNARAAVSPATADERAAFEGGPWQPIATAPRDGSNILIAFGQDGASMAKYVPGVPHPWKFIDTNDGITWLVNHAVDTEYGPTHWMPIPAFEARASQAAAPTPQQISDYLHMLDAVQREVVEREARALKPTQGTWFAEAQAAAPAEARHSVTPEPLAWMLEWTHSGDVRGQRLYDDERHCLLDAESDGGVCVSLGRIVNAPAEAREAVGWFDKSLNQIRWRDGLVNADFADRQPFYTYPVGAPADAGEAVAPDPIAGLIARHAEELERNDYAYFELAYTRQTGWMAWITDKPFQGPVLNPDRKVLARGQGGTPAEACRDALDAAQGAQGGKGGDRG